MRIRKRFAPSYFSSEPLADLHLNQSLSNGNQAKPKSDQPSNPPQQPSDQNMVIIKWALHPNAAITGKRKVGVCLKLHQEAYALLSLQICGIFIFLIYFLQGNGKWGG